MTVTVSNGCTIITGPDVRVYAALSLKSAIGLHIRTNGQMRLSRMHTPTRLLQAATNITGVKYKRGQHAIAFADLEQWCEQRRQKVEVTS